MPASFTLDTPRRLVRSRAWGALSERELLQHADNVHALFDNGTLDSSWSQLADFSDVTSFDEVSSDGIRQLAERNPWPRDSRRVVLAPSPIAFGLSRMYQLMLGSVEGDRLQVVRTEADALALLDAKGSEAED